MSKKILIVDDDIEDLETMDNIIKTKGYKTVTCGDGANALDNLKQEKVDLILIDIKMPTLSGYDLLRLLREKLNHHVKMVFISIVPEKEVNMEDIDGFIQKPFSPELLLSKIEEVLK
ncbi:response regulator [Candidatus Woesearchaeota archaeon]|jgi:CheY-like chemotaxis protein|nr:response regulator [Candidatus Woesearchaeota archaeon]MBT4321750.1 response regulator [Candidatus Woesearchaeota archaeon]MBT4631158.1 response regulator [Candidatus Woesearchaeota archaeon]